MIINKGAVINGTLQVSDTDVAVAFQSGHGYSADKLIVTTEAPEATDGVIGGVKVRADGAVRVFDATSATPDTIYKKNGYAITGLGQLCITADADPLFTIGGILASVDGYIFAEGIDSVVGQGTLVAMPSPYYGSMYTDGTGIVVDDIEMLFDDTTAPCHIKAHLNVRLAGTRRFSGLPLRETLCHIVWTLTYADDSPLPYHGEVVNEYTGATINPYTDTYGPVFGIDLFDHGDFKLTGTAYIATATGQARVASKTLLFSRAEYTGQYLYYDKVNGLNTNDGADPLGLSLTNASYVESTGIISEAGKFAGVVLDDDTSVYRINTNRWLSTSLGRVYLDEILDDNSARIDTEYKFGADATGITSSNGPKQFFVGLVPVPTTSNRFFMLCGNHADTFFETTQPINTRGKDGYLAVIGYSGKPIIKPAADTSGFTGGDGLVTFRQTDSTYNAPDNLIFNNIVLDGDLRLNPVGGAFSNLDADLTQLITRDITVINSGGATAFSMQRGDLKPVHWVNRGSYFENIRQFTYETTVAVDAFADDTSIIVTGEIPTTIPNTAAFRFDGDGFSYHYESKTFDGTNTTIPIPGQRDPGNGKLEKNYPAGTVVKFSKQIKEPVFVSATSFTMVGQSFYGEADKPTYQHYMYPSIYGGSNLFAWGKGNANSEIGFFYNFNNDSEYVLHRHSFIGNYVTGCQYFTDAGNSTNDATKPDKMTGIYAVNNSGNPREGFFLQSIGVDWFVALSDIWMDTPKWDNIENGGEERAFFAHLVLDSLRPTIQTIADWDFVLERNNVKNYKAWADRGDGLIVNLALINNKVEQDQTASNTININTSGATNVVITGNNFTAPNDADGNYLRINGVTTDIAGFNTAIGYTNTGDPQGWVDFPPTTATVPDAPTGLVAAPGDTVINASWTLSASTGDSAPTGQRVYTNTVDDFGTATQFGTDLSDTADTLQITGLTNDIEYFVWVTAFNAVGESLPSTVDSATPKLPELILGELTKWAEVTGFGQGSTNDKVSAGQDFDLEYDAYMSEFAFTPILSAGSGTNMLRWTNSTTVRWADTAGDHDFTVPTMTPFTTYHQKWSRRSGVLTLEHNGVAATGSGSTDVILTWARIAAGNNTTANPTSRSVMVKNLSLTNITAGWTIGYNIDGGEVPTPPDTSVTVAADVSTGTLDSHSITYHGIDADDWVYE